MLATRYQIKSKKRDSEFDFSLVEQFELGDSQVVSSQIVIDEAIWHPYTIDAKNKALIFLDMSPEIDLSQESFVYPRQFTEATHLLSVPYADLMDLATQVQLPENLIFIFSIGRCGSTLLHQMLNQIDGVSSYSEPDTTTILSLLHQETGISEALVGDIVEATTRLQLYAIAPKSASQVALKFRGQVNVLMQHYLERFPQASAIFMYRDALTWARSMYRFLMIFFDDDYISLETLHYRFRMYPKDRVNQALTYLDLSKPLFHRAEEIAIQFILQLENYIHSPYQNRLFPLHYEDMLANPESVITSLLNFLDISPTHAAQALKGLERDSQAGTGLARNFESRELDAESEALFLSILSKHPHLADRNFRL